MNGISQITDIIVFGLPAYKNKEVEDFLKRIPESARETFESHIFEASFWKKMEDREVPLDYLKERKGAWNKEKGDYDYFEYFPEEYTLQELNRLFPGWWEEDMRYEYYPDLRVINVSGYLCVEYPTLDGRKKVTKRWAIGSVRVEFSKEKNESTGLLDASQPDDRFKAARTEWIKLAGKHYGIGLEIYHQRITAQMRSEFEDRIRNWGVYSQEAKDIAATIKTGQAFRNYLRELPSVDQTERILKALGQIPKDLKDKEGHNIHDRIWRNFVKLKNDSHSNRVKTEEFIRKVEQTAEKLNQKEGE